MSEQTPTGGKLPSTSLRTKVVDRLTEEFASDALTLEQFEAKLDLAHRASSEEALQVILDGLGPAPANTPAQRPGIRMVSSDVVRERSLIFGFWGGATRSGTWTPARKNYVIAFQGGAELDLREANFAPGITEITVFCAMGGVNIIASPDLQIDFGGVGIMGGFDAEPTARGVVDAASPIVRIRGVAVWGGAGVEIRYQGETAAEARQRKRISRKIKKELPPGN